jgi:hypothetical protein
MASGFLALLLAASSAPGGAFGADIDWSKAETVTVKLTDFEYSPAYLRFHAGSPVRLILVNQGTGRHDFSAPEFFSAVTLRPGSSAPAEGTIDLAKNETKGSGPAAGRDRQLQAQMHPFSAQPVRHARRDRCGRRPSPIAGLGITQHRHRMAAAKNIPSGLSIAASLARLL